MENHVFSWSEKICTWISVQMMHQNAKAPHNENINTFGTSQSTARLPAFFRICKKIPPIARVLQSCSWLKIHRMLRWSMFPSSFTHMHVICIGKIRKPPHGGRVSHLCGTQQFLEPQVLAVQRGRNCLMAELDGLGRSWHLQFLICIHHSDKNWTH